MDDFDLAFGPVIDTFKHNGESVYVRGWSDNDHTYHCDSVYRHRKTQAAIIAAIDRGRAAEDAELSRRAALRSAEVKLKNKQAMYNAVMDGAILVGGVGALYFGMPVLAGIFVASAVAHLAMN